VLAVLKEDAGVGVALRSRESSEPPEGWVLLDMIYAGICGSDVATYRWHAHRHGLRQHLPFVMGHEGVGRVRSVSGSSDGLVAGTRVVPEPVLSCFSCAQCLRGRTNLCERALRLGSQRPGTMAHELLVPASACQRVPEHMSDRQAALLEVAAVAMHAARRAPDVAGARCVVVGPGAVGLCLVRVLLAMGAAEVMLLGRSRSAERLTLGTAAGATGVVSLDEDGTIPPHVVGEFDLAFEAAGSPAALVLAAQLTRPGGAVVALGGYQDTLVLDYSKLLRYREIDLLASRARVPGDWRVLLSMLASGRLDLSSVPTTVLPLAQASTAFDLAASGSVLKVLLDCRPTGESGG
jgi:2-desacetyl-2-hydroxyethyl bacteriochlorophyllide A dehydrogenase